MALSMNILINSKYRIIKNLLLASVLLSQSLSCFATDKLTMNMRDADIRALIQWVADNTGKNIVVHKDVKGKVTVLSPQPVTPEEAYQVFLSVLQIHDFAVIETPEALKIVPNSIATRGAPPSAGSSAHADMVVSVLKIENISAVRLSEIIRPLLSKDVVLTPYAATNVLVIADHASNV